MPKPPRTADILRAHVTAPIRAAAAEQSARKDAMQPRPLTVNVTSRKLEVAMTLDPVALAGLVVPDGAPRSDVIMTVAGRTLTASKSLRRAVKTITEAGADNVSVVLQGELVGDVIEGTGIAGQVKGQPSS